MTTGAVLRFSDVGSVIPRDPTAASFLQKPQ